MYASAFGLVNRPCRPPCCALIAVVAGCVIAQVMRQMGNIKANHIWEGRMTDAERARKPRPDATMAYVLLACRSGVPVTFLWCRAREKFIRDKYERCLYKVDAATAAAIAAGSMAAPVSAPVASSPAPHAVAPPAAVHHSEPGVSFGHSSLVGRQGRRRSSSGNVLDHHVTHGPAHTSAASTNPAVLRRLAKKLVSTYVGVSHFVV